MTGQLGGDIPQSKPRRRPEERPAEIVAAALEVFGEEGLAGARLAEIARRAGMAKGTIYLYFASKDELFCEVVRQTVLRTLQELGGRRRGGTPERRLRAFMREFWDYLRSPEFQSIYRLMLGELHQFPEISRFFAEEVRTVVSTPIEAIMREGVESGEFRDVDPRVASRMLLALFTKHALWVSRRDVFTPLGTRSDEQVLNEMIDFFFYGLVAHA